MSDEPSSALGPAVLRGDVAAAVARLEEELRGRLEQAQLALRSDAFQDFHRITLAPTGPPAATDRLREPERQVELLTDGSRCWLRVVGGETWLVSGVDCVSLSAAGPEKGSYTN